MFRPFYVWIGLRYTRAKRRNHFISFISWASMIGIALGVMVLITVISVMNGFDKVIRERFFEMAQQVIVTGDRGQLSEDPSLEAMLKKTPKVVATAPFISGQAMLTHDGVVQAVYLQGIDPKQELTISELDSKMTQGHLLDLKPQKFGIILGEELALNMGVNVGDPITVVVPKTSVTITGMTPRFRQFKVTGIFQVGRGFDYARLAFIHMEDARALYQIPKSVTGYRLKLIDLYDAPSVAKLLKKQLGASYMVVDWTNQYGNLFEAIAMEKTMMFLIVMLIIAVAAFNLVSTLVMVVTDKKSDIAILQTLGATPRQILMMFVVQGGLLGVLGTLLGMLGGTVLSLHITSLVSTFEHYFHVKLLSGNVYYVDYLPSDLCLKDVFHICGVSILMSFVATLYPAWRAAKVQPAEALRYD